MKKNKIVTIKDVKEHPKVVAYIEQADKQMSAIGYTEHGSQHAEVVAKRAQDIILSLGFSKREGELSAIAGYLHDIGNMISRKNHETAGALISMNILEDLKMKEDEIAKICGAIGNHEEEIGDPVSNISSAVIIADKSDVRRSRVKSPKTLSQDIHDRINYSVEESILKVEKNIITLELEINTNIAPVMEYFEIFLQRMIISRRAAKFLGCEFKLIINKYKFL